MNPYHPYKTWEELAATNPAKWWNLFKICALEEIKDLDKRPKTKKNLASRKNFEELVSQADTVLTSL